MNLVDMVIRQRIQRWQSEKS